MVAFSRNHGEEGQRLGTPSCGRHASRAACASRRERDILLRALSETTGHPTADQLVRKVRKLLPTVSHATVYRNANELVQAGLLGTLERSGAAVQFEVNPEHHHHFVCRRCGHVWDVYSIRWTSRSTAAGRGSPGSRSSVGTCNCTVSAPAANNPSPTRPLSLAPESFAPIPDTTAPPLPLAAL